MCRLCSKTLAAWLILLSLLLGVYLTSARGAARSQSHATPAQLVLAATVHPDGTWEGEAHIAPSAQARATALFAGYALDYNLSPGSGAGRTFSLTGDEASEIVEMALSAGQRINQFAGPVAISLRGNVRAGQVMTLALTANLSTGYAWEVAPDSDLVQVNGLETRQTALGLGVPAKQVILLRAARTGPVGLRLLYRRPWEKETAPAVLVSLDRAGGDLAEACALVSAPLPQTPPADIFGIRAAEQFAPPRQVASPQALPSSYDWCATHGGCTSVKDQGNCGSCWAFATVGPFEALLQADGKTTDLAEQYLISCNNVGWGCGGGWFAHDYHWNVKPSGEPEAGAVLETSFPYKAADVSCAGPYDHPHKITSWQYVGNDSSIPSVGAIKQAIYDHGPVAAAVCVDSAFQHYSGGVFAPGTSCNDINHAIVLVGWNDAEQTWTLRNSWGSGWGEEGYMRIRYGTSNVGYAANYIVYTPETPFVASSWAYLPLVAYRFESNPLLDNGDFENGQDGSWEEYSARGWDLIMNESSLSISPHGGSWAAWLGGDDYETAILSQMVTVPAGATTLNYWYLIGSEDACGYDYAYVRFGSDTLETYDLCKSNNTGNWTLGQIDVTGWRGQSVELRFVAETDSSLNSNFFLDDVSFVAATAPATASPAPAGAASHATTPKK